MIKRISVIVFMIIFIGRLIPESGYASTNTSTETIEDNYTIMYGMTNTFHEKEYGWSEEELPLNIFDSLLTFSLTSSGNNYYDTWILRSTNTYNYSNNRTMTLESYTLTFYDETKLCKGVTRHNASLYGYVSAHFETIFGKEKEGSYSGRQYSYYGAEAVTPFTLNGCGWNGIAHTNCGT